MSQKEYTLCCNCGKKLNKGTKVFRINGYCNIYCSPTCLAYGECNMEHRTLDDELADTCGIIFESDKVTKDDGKRKNPEYEAGHCFTVTICKKCGEYYEADCVLPHICRKQNSYPELKSKEDK